ncbi:NHSL1 protein, partial [Ceuthmochares aereus]|nr:NHSL1 protein [Ceuthmochares aereus]
ATSNLDSESKKATRPKLSWQQPVNVFLATGRPPGMEQLHQEAQLNLQSLLQEERGWCGSQAAGLGEAICVPLLSLWWVTSLSPSQPPSRQAAEEETTGTTALGTQPPAASLSLPTSPDKQLPWARAFPLPTVEEKQWHQSCSIQTNIVPINIS